jgi:hypothetical protein
VIKDGRVYVNQLRSHPIPGVVVEYELAGAIAHKLSHDVFEEEVAEAVQ